MTGRLLAELKQTKPFRTRADEAYLNIIRTADHLKRSSTELFKAHGISPAQYNVLRILRGAQGKPILCGEVSNRLVTFEPDVTRLVDRLVTGGLVERSRGADDKRQVLLVITPKGLALLKRLDAPITALHDDSLGQLSDERLTQLINLLEDIRLGPASSPSLSSPPST